MNVGILEAENEEDRNQEEDDEEHYEDDSCRLPCGGLFWALCVCWLVLLCWDGHALAHGIHVVARLTAVEHALGGVEGVGGVDGKREADSAVAAELVSTAEGVVVGARGVVGGVPPRVALAGGDGGGVPGDGVAAVEDTDAVETA